MQVADGGVVRAIHVVDGQEVKQGQALIELDATAARAEAEQARQSLSAAEADRSRAEALVGAADGKKTPYVPPVTAEEQTPGLQQSLVQARVSEHEEGLAALVQERAQRRADLAMVDAEIEKITQQLPLMEAQLSGYKALEAKGFAPRMKVADVEQQVIGTRQDLTIRKAEHNKQAAALSGVERQIGKLNSEFRATSLTSLNEADANFRLRQEEMKKAEEKASLTTLVAPIDGVVAQLKVHTLGAVVKPADPLLIIVPRDSDLVVEAMVLNRDVGFVHEGQAVEVKLEAFPFTRYGIVKGKVQRLSRDSVQDEKLGLVYPVEVKLSQKTISVDGKATKLSPGLSATAEIKTGSRRIIEYLLSPLARRASEAGRER